jgi:hypothetical protein
MTIDVTFPYPAMDWEDAYLWAKDRNFFGCLWCTMTNPEHWDREENIKVSGLLTETTFTWRFENCFEEPSSDES